MVQAWRSLVTHPMRINGYKTEQVFYPGKTLLRHYMLGTTSCLLSHVPLEGGTQRTNYA